VSNTSEGIRAVPFGAAHKRAGLSKTGAYRQVKSGGLRTFLIGSRRFVTEEELERFIRRQIAASRHETAEERAARVAPAVAARARKREAEPTA
jgi:hypothetical protein